MCTFSFSNMNSQLGFISEHFPNWRTTSSLVEVNGMIPRHSLACESTLKIRSDNVTRMSFSFDIATSPQFMRPGKNVTDIGLNGMKVVAVGHLITFCLPGPGYIARIKNISLGRNEGSS